MALYDRSSVVGFGLNPLDRLSEKRDDMAFVETLREAPTTRFLVLAGDIPVFRKQGDAHALLFSRDEAAAFGEPAHDIFLGQDPHGGALFALGFDKARAAALGTDPGLALIDLRTVAMQGHVTPAVLGELGGAKAMLDWHQRHRFCANCGAPSRVSAAGWRRECDTCGAQHFPRVDPVVIMLAIDGERCLLGRQARFPVGMYSALAGFLEPGETIEDAVRREIKEEAGIACAHVRYFASQPWPFPSSLMIGCFARAESTELVVDTVELEDARWFTRAEVREMIAGTHPAGLAVPQPFAIAYHLIKAFAENERRLLPEPAGA